MRKNSTKIYLLQQTYFTNQTKNIRLLLFFCIVPVMILLTTLSMTNTIEISNYSTQIESYLLKLLQFCKRNFIELIKGTLILFNREISQNKIKNIL